MDQISLKRYFRPKTKTVNIPTEFCIFELVLSTTFRLQLTNFIFRPNFPKRVFPVENEKSKYHHWILHIQIRLGAIFLGATAILGQVSESWLSMAPLGHVGLTKTLWHFLGQSRESRPSMAPLDHVELTKMQKQLESKIKSKNENWNQNENKNENSLLFSFLFLFTFSFLFSFFSFFSFKFYYGTPRPPYISLFECMIPCWSCFKSTENHFLLFS